RTRRARPRVKSLRAGAVRKQEFLRALGAVLHGGGAAGGHAVPGALAARLTSPGLPDIYQGDEFWSFNLVDPDNRRPVDWRRRLRARERPGPTRDTLKLHLIRRVLRLRAEHPDAFAGSYEPLDLGPDRLGFVRGGRIRVVVPLRPGDRVEG